MTVEQPEAAPWYAGKPGVVLLYRVNRRPLPQGNLFAEQPESVFDHLVEVLLFGEPVLTGQRYQREWLLGNRDIDLGQRLVTGQIGWETTGEERRDHFDPDEKAWVDVVDERNRAASAPFVFDPETRILGVLRHPSFSEKTIAVVFSALLNRGENARSHMTTEWDVEPIGDEQSFREWIARVDAVLRVNLTAKLPNPEGLDEFAPVWNRMAATRARLIREIIESSNPDLGLANLEEDEVVRAFLAMSTSGFGYVTASGTSGGKKVSYDQRSQVAREQTEPLPSGWRDVLAAVVGVVVRRRNRRASQST